MEDWFGVDFGIEYLDGLVALSSASERRKVPDGTAIISNK